MPLKKCAVSGKSGYKWGDSGKCYTGRDAKKQAIRQGVAIEGPEKFQEKASECELDLDESDILAILDQMSEDGYSLKAIVATIFALRSVGYGGGYTAYDNKKKKKKKNGRPKDDNSQGDEKAGYPPNCNEGYVEKNGKCVPDDDTKVA